MNTFLIIFGILEIISILLVLGIATTNNNNKSLTAIFGLLTFASFILSLIFKLIWWIITI